MPVAGNEEHGVLSRQTSICSAGIPIKKRKFPFIPPPSPPREEQPSSLPEKVDAKNKEESSSGNDSSFNDNIAKYATDNSVVDKSSLKEVKKETTTDMKISSVQTDIDLSGVRASKIRLPTQLGVKEETPYVVRVNSTQKKAFLPKSGAQEIGSAIVSGSVNDVESKVNRLVNEKSASPTVPISNPGFPPVNVKKEVVSNQAERDCKLKFSAGLGNAELSLASKELLVSALKNKEIDFSAQKPDNLDPSLLSLSLSKEELGENMRANSTVSSDSVHTSFSNRSNWDLNTTMDSWEGSVEGAASRDTVGIHELNRSSAKNDVKQSLSSTSVARVDKGKQVMEPVEERSDLSLSSISSCQPYNAEYSLQLSLSPSLSQFDFIKEHFDSLSREDPSQVIQYFIPQRSFVNKNSSGSGTVKSEPADENARFDSLLVVSSPVGSLDLGLVKRETALSVATSKTSSSDFPKLIVPRSVKSEVGQESNQETCGAATDALHQPGGRIVQRQESCSSSSNTLSVSLTPRQPCLSKLPACSELSACTGVSNQSEHSIHNKGSSGNKDILNSGATDMIPKPVSHSGEEPTVSDGKVNSGQAMIPRSNRKDEPNFESDDATEVSAGDEEKISLSADMLDEDAYDSDYESDGTHAVIGQMDMDDGQCGKEDKEFEDGEVRDHPMLSSVQDSPSVQDPPCEGMESENIKLVNDGTKIGLPADQSCADEKLTEMEVHIEGRNDHTGEYIGPATNENGNQLIEDDVSLPNTVSYEVTIVQADGKAPEKAPVDQSVEKDAPGVKEDDLCGDVDTNLNGTKETNVSETVVGDNVKGTKRFGNSDSSLSKAEVTSNAHEPLKDSIGGGNRSRIIKLPCASNLTSPTKIRSFSGRPFTPQSGRDRYSDFEGENLHRRGNRHDMYAGGSNKYMRDRIQDRSFRNSGMDFMRGRGRVTGRLDTLQRKWDPEHDFASQSFDLPADYRFSRRKHASAVADTGLQSSDYVVEPDAGVRKPITQDFHSFRHPSSRRLSPGARDGSTRNLSMMRRIPRNIAEAGSDLPGHRNEGKFTRGSPEDISDSIFTRSQVSYEELEGQFVQGNRSFSAPQRRGFPHVQSKSPISARSRSPGPWSSPRRRFPDGYNNLSDQTQHRSPAMYRVDRMRSPDRVCYTDEMSGRRRVSPNYLARRSNDIRDIDSAREHGHLRSISSSRRSPSDRMFPRSTRRLDVVDARERVDGDEYFAGPVHPGRFNEFRGDGCNDERKKFGERRGFVRPFRATYSGSNETYRFNSEEGSRALRFCQDQDTESFERSNLRERDFDEGIKSRPLVAPRQHRSVEEQEGNYRQTGQVWHDDSFNEVSRLKRRRF